MKLNVNKNNRYLPKSVGVEVEAESTTMQSLKLELPNLFPTGNAESNNIYECQTAPMTTENFINVVLLGEVTRLCIPNYIKGSYDPASASAHCHTVGFNYELEEEHIEALMVGLMPFMSIAWMRPQFEKYTFRASVTGYGADATYARLVTKDHYSVSRYDERTTWIRNQQSKHRVPAVEMRTNENSILWVYFINIILTNQSMIDKLRKVANTTEYNELTKIVMSNSSRSLNVYHKTIEKVKKFLVPFLLKNLENIVNPIDPRQQEYAKELLKAYLTEDIKTYSTLIEGVLAEDEELLAGFDFIKTTVSSNKSNYNVLEEI